jgi:hypothetical protein
MSILAQMVSEAITRLRRYGVPPNSLDISEAIVCRTPGMSHDDVMQLFHETVYIAVDTLVTADRKFRHRERPVAPAAH